MHFSNHILGSVVMFVFMFVGRILSYAVMFACILAVVLWFLKSFCIIVYAHTQGSAVKFMSFFAIVS